MKTLKLFFLALVSITIFSACQSDDDDLQPGYLELIDNIPTSTYSTADAFENGPDIYGAWEVIGTTGGLAGGGYNEDFDFFVAKPNGIFGVIRNDSLLTSGEIRLQTDTTEFPLVNLLSEDAVNIQILTDNEKYINIQSDTLYLMSPCCDRFDTILKRIE